jgi:hypothetical protein
MGMTLQTDAEGVPTFGADLTMDHRPVRVRVHHIQTGQMIDEPLEFWVDPGAGPVLGFLRAQAHGNEAAVMNAAVVLITAALVDDDGIGADAKPPAPPEDLDFARAGAAEMDAWRDEFEAWQDMAGWSSRRRFLHFADSRDHRISGSVIVELAEWSARQAVGRGGVPTITPGPSSPGQTPPQGGSTAARPRKAASTRARRSGGARTGS